MKTNSSDNKLMEFTYDHSSQTFYHRTRASQKIGNLAAIRNDKQT